MADAPKKRNGEWHIDFRPAGEFGPRYRKKFKTKKAADKFISDETLKAGNQGANYTAPKTNSIRLKELAEQWYDLFGYKLVDNVRTKSRLMATIMRLGNPVASKFNALAWETYRKKRTTQTDPRTGRLISNNTINHEQYYLSAVFTKLAKVQKWEYANPLMMVKPLDIKQVDLIFLSELQMNALLTDCKHSQSPDLYAWASLGLATGARWSEIANLTAFHIRNGYVHFVDTKGKVNRMVPISAKVQELVLKDRIKSGKLFKNPRKAFSTALKSARIELPRGQFTHILRHTYASWYVINGGSIRKLQKLLGHKHISMTERYSHLKPANLSESLEKNPLENLIRNGFDV